MTGRHAEVPDEVSEYASNKANKLSKYHNRISSVEYVLDHESDLLTLEIIVKADGIRELVSKETGPDPFVLIDLITEKVERQLAKQKEKQRDHRPNG